MKDSLLSYIKTQTQSVPCSVLMWNSGSLVSIFRTPVQQGAEWSWMWTGEWRSSLLLKMVEQSHGLYYQKEVEGRPEGCSFLPLVSIMLIGLNPCEWSLCLRELPPPVHTHLSPCVKNGSVIWGESSRPRCVRLQDGVKRRSSVEGGPLTVDIHDLSPFFLKPHPLSKMFAFESLEERPLSYEWICLALYLSWLSDGPISAWK